jgi:hypothetical protein
MREPYHKLLDKRILKGAELIEHSTEKCVIRKGVYDITYRKYIKDWTVFLSIRVDGKEVYSGINPDQHEEVKAFWEILNNWAYQLRNSECDKFFGKIEQWLDNLALDPGDMPF